MFLEVCGALSQMFSHPHFYFEGPINQEMRNLIQSLQKHNQQLKADAQRNRRKVKEIQCEVNKVDGINSLHTW